MKAAVWLCVVVVLVGCGGDDLFGGSQTVTVIDETVKVSFLGYYSWSFNLNRGDDLLIVIDSDRDVTVYLLDAREFEAYEHGETFYADVKKSRVYDATIRYPVAASGFYYLVLDNTFSVLTSKTVSVLATVKI